ncbi:hypothetical protein E3E12_08380 [Formicincola oecophyllae]|uniref:Uncharacterized protein n=1 Tax=Formicincola oecophyllae TaxID=2558361 RepID=A0A4Y6U9P7_9PROT|nr:hypothetical protein [Formicincola oecophyllae]QDH14199.1 hypothetical protein E3E12_08380 [Formicincola oecophyllae]
MNTRFILQPTLGATALLAGSRQGLGQAARLATPLDLTIWNASTKARRHAYLIFEALQEGCSFWLPEKTLDEWSCQGLPEANPCFMSQAMGEKGFFAEKTFLCLRSALFPPILPFEVSTSFAMPQAALVPGKGVEGGRKALLARFYVGAESCDIMGWGLFFERNTRFQPSCPEAEPQQGSAASQSITPGDQGSALNEAESTLAGNVAETGMSGGAPLPRLPHITCLPLSPSALHAAIKNPLGQNQP